MIILREKDLPETEYEKLAGEVLKICRKYDQLCMLHLFTDVARRLDHPYIHLPMQLFLHMTQEERKYFKKIGVLDSFTGGSTYCTGNGCVIYNGQPYLCDGV